MPPRNARSRPEVRSSQFKYYLHDGVDCFRLQLIGSLTEADVRDLSGCWRTAKTTLHGRPLLLDLRLLHFSDEPGREWLLEMVREGANCLPESYFRDLMGKETKPSHTGRGEGSGKGWSRLADLIRGGNRDLDAEPSSQG